MLIAAVTGILYIFPENYDNLKLIIKTHTVDALYGWNLAGLAIILRYNDFPVNKIKIIIPLHWITILIFTLLGYRFPIFAILAIASFSALLLIIFFASSANATKDELLPKANPDALH